MEAENISTNYNICNKYEELLQLVAERNVALEKELDDCQQVNLYNGCVALKKVFFKDPSRKRKLKYLYKIISF